VVIVFGSHAQDHGIDSFLGLRSGGKLPATAAATGMNFAPLHIDVVEAEDVASGLRLRPDAEARFAGSKTLSLILS